VIPVAPISQKPLAGNGVPRLAFNVSSFLVTVISEAGFPGPAASDGGGSAVGRIEIITLKRSIRPQDPGRRDTGKVILLTNGIIVMAGSIYASTHSLAATAVAGCAGLASVVVYVWRKLRPASLAIYETTRNRPSRFAPV
jgi:hypothetical protein